MANDNQGGAFSKVTRADLSPLTKDYACAQSFARSAKSIICWLRLAFSRDPSSGYMPALLEALKRAAENHRRTASSISQWRSLHMTKETQKALAIIIASLGVLVILLFWANHLRPHP